MSSYLCDGEEGELRNFRRHGRQRRRLWCGLLLFGLADVHTLRGDVRKENRHALACTPRHTIEGDDSRLLKKAGAKPSGADWKYL